jgi:aminoglycoside phosphotransferase (APT) family kinase protein
MLNDVTELDARTRLARVLDLARLRDGGEATALPSASNDAWHIGDQVVRVCWRGNIERLVREAALCAALPPEIHCPPVTAAGHDGQIAWTVSRYAPGRRVSEMWPRLGHHEQRRLIDQVSTVLRALHSWTPPARVRRTLDDHTNTVPTTPSDIIGLDICPLPARRALHLAAHAAAGSLLSRELAVDAEAALRRLAPADPYHSRATAVVHSDLNFSNILCDHDGRITAVLDFEWARLGAPDQDLEPFLRAVDWAGTADTEMIEPVAMRRILGWIAEDYPDLFAHPNLLTRLHLYQLAYTVRELYTWPQPGPGQHPAPDHPAWLLRRFASTDAHLRAVLPPIG